MKNKFLKILGVCLTIAVLASMLVIANPGTASAGTLAWSGEMPFPTAGGAQIDDFAVAPNGTTIYAIGAADLDGLPGFINGTQLILKSTNSGASWASAGTVAGTAPGGVGNLVATTTRVDAIAIAPDTADGSFVAILATDSVAGQVVYLSTDGGAVWQNAGDPTGATNVYNTIEVGPTTPAASHTIALGGDNGAGTAKVWLMAIGGLFGGWNDVTAAPWTVADFIAGGTVYDIEFSPKYAADYTFVIASDNGTSVFLQMANSLNMTWNGALYDWGTGAAAGVVVAAHALGADLELSPSYYGFDTASRVAYVAVGGGSQGLYRVSNKLVAGLLTGVDVNTVGLNTSGDKLVAGAWLTNTVYRIASPATALAIPGTAIPNAAFKGPGVNGPVIVSYAGANVVASTYGAQSAFSWSTDDGKSFVDVSLINAAAANTVDFALAADGSKKYVVTIDGTYASVWKQTTAWQRVLVVTPSAGVTDYGINLAPESSDVAVLSEMNSTAASLLYYTNDGGNSFWERRIGNASFADLAVESASVFYAVAGNIVYKSDGYLWTPVRTNTFAGYSVTSMGAGNLLVAGTTGKVAFLTGGAWAESGSIGGGNVYAVATGLAKDSYIYATSDTSNNVYRWKIGTNMFTWDAMYGTATLTGVPTGIGVGGSTLYVFTNNGVDLNYMYRTMVPTIANANFFWDMVGPLADTNFPASVTAPDYLNFTECPNSIVVTMAGTDPKIWALDTTAGLKSFVDILTVAVPDLVGPVDKFENQINVETGKANNIVFQWKAVAGTPFPGTTYKLEIALDAAFLQTVYPAVGAAALGNTMAIIGETGNTGVFPFQADTTYYWRVKIVAPVASNYSKVRSFKIAPLAPLKISSPASGAQGVSVLPTFVWSPVTGATEYQIIVSDRENFDIITFSHNTAQAVYAVTEDEQLAYNTVYYWRVRASKPDTAVTQYQTGIFTTEQKAVPTKEPITITQPGPTTITVSVPPPQEVIPAYLLWIIIGIGAILVIALIVLIVRTRRTS